MITNRFLDQKPDSDIPLENKELNDMAKKAQPKQTGLLPVGTEVKINDPNRMQFDGKTGKIEAVDDDTISSNYPYLVRFETTSAVNAMAWFKKYDVTPVTNQTTLPPAALFILAILFFGLLSALTSCGPTQPVRPRLQDSITIDTLHSEIKPL